MFWKYIAVLITDLYGINKVVLKITTIWILQSCTQYFGNLDRYFDNFIQSLLHCCPDQLYSSLGLGGAYSCDELR